MKRIDEMTREEIVALTDERINMLIDYECAMEGKPLLPDSPIKPIVPEYAPDTLIYTVAEVTTKCADHAQRILEAINSGERVSKKYVSGPSYMKMLEPVSSKVTITSETVFSIELWDKIKNEKLAADVWMEEYKQLKKEYDDAVNKRAEISDRIWEWIGNSRNEEYRRERIRNDFKRYLELSEGNKSIAMNFLKKAHIVPEDIEEELLGDDKQEAHPH